MMALKEFGTKVIERNQRLILTMISKKWVVLYASTALLVFKLIPPEVWAFQAAFTVGAEITARKLLVSEPVVKKSIEEQGD